MPDDKMQPTIKLNADAEGIAAAAALLRGGGLVAIPTETVYGLAADAANDAACARIFAAKGRPAHNPLIVHVADLEQAEALAVFDPSARAVARAFWPGALSLVLPLRKGAALSPLVTAGKETLALRIPAHETTQRLLRAFGGAIAAPSANRSGKVSATTPEHVMADLGGQIEAVLDAGRAPLGLESTILSCDQPGKPPLVLRPGALTAEELAPLLGPLATDQSTPDAPKAPGQLSSHYAPDAPLRLNAAQPEPDELWVGFGPSCQGAALSLSASGDLGEAAAHLFERLREADALTGHGRGAAQGLQAAQGKARIAFAPIPETGLGRAINDRLRRAAHGKGR